MREEAHLEEEFIKSQNSSNTKKIKYKDITNIDNDTFEPLIDHSHRLNPLHSS
jgi:hypothetical protein